jgi:capsular exopolysaccharide synthesis family protein
MQYWRAIRRRLLLIILSGVVAGAIAGYVTQKIPKIYSTSTTALVNPYSNVQIFSNTTSGNAGSVAADLNTVMSTYVSLFSTQPVRDRLDRTHVTQQQIDAAGGSVSASIDPNTTLINITVTSTDPKAAEAVAQNIVPAFNLTLDELQAQVGNSATSRLQPLVPWEVPTNAPGLPISPNLKLNVIFAVLAALGLGSGLAVLIDQLDRTVKSDSEVRDRLNLPVLGSVIRVKPRPEEVPLGMGLISYTNPDNPIAENYRSIRTSLLFRGVDKPLNTLVITSTLPSEGKSTVVCNLGVTLAQAGKRVVLVDADVRRPVLHQIFHKDPSIGLGNLLLHDRPQSEVVLPTIVPNLQLICGGPLPSAPSDLLGSRSMKRLLSELKESADIIIVDTPPIGLMTDGAVLAAQTDGVILVIESGRTPTSAVSHAKKTLRDVNANVLGVVLNKVRIDPRAYAYDYYGYSHHPSAGTFTGKPAAVVGAGSGSGKSPRAGDSS